MDRTNVIKNETSDRLVPDHPQGEVPLRILEIALDLFSRRGYEAAGIQEIAYEAGITKPTLYYYFGSKQGLLEAIVSRFGGEYIETLSAAAVYQHDLVMNLRKLLKNTLGFAKKNPQFFRFAANIFFSGPETASFTAGKKLRADLVLILTELFAAAAKDHGNMKNRQLIYGETFFALLQSCAILSLNGELKIDDPLICRIIHQYMHGIFS
jgi:TetR/AcrR family transcriptional regulator